MLLLHSIAILIQSVSYPPSGYKKESLEVIGKLPSNVRFESWIRLRKATNNLGDENISDQYFFAWTSTTRYSYHLIKDGLDVNGGNDLARSNGPTGFTYDRICGSPDGTFFTLDRKIVHRMNSCLLFNIGGDGIHKWLKGANISSFLVARMGRPKKERYLPNFLLPRGFDRNNNLSCSVSFDFSKGHWYKTTFNAKSLKTTKWTLDKSSD